MLFTNTSVFISLPAFLTSHSNSNRPITWQYCREKAGFTSGTFVNRSEVYCAILKGINMFKTKFLCCFENETRFIPLSFVSVLILSTKTTKQYIFAEVFCGFTCSSFSRIYFTVSSVRAHIHCLLLAPNAATV